VRQRLLEARRRESGFTLIELLIVIVILGVLAAVVILAVGAFDDRGEEAACKSDVKAVEVAVEAYRAKNGAYPETLDKLVNDPNENYLRSLPNTDENSQTAAYYIKYYPETGGVEGYFKNGTLCAGSSLAPGPGGTEPGGGASPSPSPSPSPSTSTSSTPPAIAPSTPTNVNVGSCSGSNSNRTCTATWSASSGTPTPTYVWQRVVRSGRSCDNSDFNGGGVLEGTATTTSVQLTGLNRSTNYCFRVKATNAAGDSNWSQVRSFQA
jgi:prepilin-type N-terminal cleavage/methylation domain